MLKYAISPVLTVAFIFGGPQAAQGEPLTVAGVLLGWIIGQTISYGFQETTGYANPWHMVDGVYRPNIREMKRQLDALAARDKVNAAEIYWLRNALQDRMTRAEVEKLIMASLTRIDKSLADHAQRLIKLERSTQDLKDENLRLRGIVTSLETQGSSHNVRIGRVESRVDLHDKMLKDQERRIQELERKVAVLGAAGFDLMSKRDFEKAIQAFEEAIENDPADPGYHFGKALALKKLNRQKDAEKEVKTGAAAEYLRPPGKWYLTVVERVQGPDRLWLGETRNKYHASRARFLASSN